MKKILILRRLLSAFGLVVICILLAPASSFAAVSGSSSSIDNLNARMRDAARDASKARSLDELVGPHLPTMPLHTEFVVETNRKGQVTRVRSGKNSQNSTFDLMTYGNALQTYIRTVSGRADAGTFRITYDYSPKTHNVRRDVSVVSLGGVDPNAEGAVYALAHAQAAHQLHRSPSPAPH